MFTTKDSGKRLKFKSGMVRDVNDEKPMYILCWQPMLKRWAELMTRGAKKYGKNNWMLAEGWDEKERFQDSALRHMYQWLEGDTSEDHAAAVFFNIAGAEYCEKRITDRLKQQEEDFINTIKEHNELRKEKTKAKNSNK